MKIQKRDDDIARLIITGMIIDKQVLAQIASKWQGDGLFPNAYLNRVAGFCIRYMERYDDAPGEQIQAMFISWANAGARDEEEVGLIEKLLTQLSDDFVGTINAPHVLDVASDYFARIRLEKLCENIEGDIARGDLAKATARLTDYTPPHLSASAGIDLLDAKLAVQAAFDNQAEVLVQYPDALRHFFGTALARDSFISFMAPEKRGKSFWLIDLAWRSMLAGRRVVFVAAGDMSQGQMIRRFGTRAAGKPTLPGIVRVPYDLEHVPDAHTYEIAHREETYTDENVLTKRDTYKALKEYGTTGKHLRLYCYPADTINVAGIRSELLALQRTGWVPDVVVIDYADILAPMYGNMDTREQTNKTWMALRSLAQQMHCLVVTATQSDAASYKSDYLDMTNFSEDKRKMSHVNGMVGINQTKSEKDDGVYRLNWVNVREQENAIDKFCYTAGCLALANPAIESVF